MESLFDLKMLSNTGIQKMADIGLMPFFFLLVVTLVSSLFISHLYIKFYGTKGTGSTLHRAFPLMGVAITSIFVSLQFSIPLSLGLLGSLSIVRFRTPIKDPEEVGFILLVIASSLTCATFNIPFLILILTVSVIGLIVLKADKRFFRKYGNDGMLVIKVKKETYSKNAKEIFNIIKENVVKSKLDSVTDGDECTITYTFSSFTEEVMVDLNSKLASIDTDIKTNVFLG